MDQTLPRLLGGIVGRSDCAQQRDQFTRRDGKNAVLELHHVGYGEHPAGAQELLDRIGAIRIGPQVVQGILIRPAGRDQIVVGGVEESLLRVFNMRQILDG